MTRRFALLSFLLLLPSTPPASAQAADPLAAVQQAIDSQQPDQALAALAPILKREPKNARALLLRSTARCMEGEVEACRQDLDRALELDPTLRQGWLNRSALAIAEKRYDAALAALAEAERLDPQAPDNALNQGAVQLLAGRLEAASASFERHLAANPGSADAYYLVASNFALAGYSALAVQHLARAIQLDERSRVRARTDANFNELAANRGFQQLLDTDSWSAPFGSPTANRVYTVPFTGTNSPILTAVLNALQIARTPMDSRVEVTEAWALLWADVRIKLVRQSDNETRIELTGPPGKLSAAAWEARTTDLFAAIDRELLKLERNQLLKSGSARP